MQDRMQDTEIIFGSNGQVKLLNSSRLMRRLYWRDQYQSPREPFLKMRIPIIALLEKHILPWSGWMSMCSLFCPNTFHSLRAIATTVLHAAGADHALAREIVGHDSEISHQLHIRPSDDQRKEAMEKLSEMIVPWHAVKIPLRWRSVILSLFVPSVSVPWWRSVKCTERNSK